MSTLAGEDEFFVPCGEDAFGFLFVVFGLGGIVGDAEEEVFVGVTVAVDNEGLSVAAIAHVELDLDVVTRMDATGLGHALEFDAGEGFDLQQVILDGNGVDVAAQTLVELGNEFALVWQGDARFDEHFENGGFLVVAHVGHAVGFVGGDGSVQEFTRDAARAVPYFGHAEVGAVRFEPGVGGDVFVDLLLEEVDVHGILSVVENDDAVFVHGAGEAGEGCCDLFCCECGGGILTQDKIEQDVDAESILTVAQDGVFGAVNAEEVVGAVATMIDALADWKLASTFMAMDGTQVGLGEVERPFVECDVLVGFAIEDGAEGVEGSGRSHFRFLA